MVVAPLAGADTVAFQSYASGNHHMVDTQIREHGLLVPWPCHTPPLAGDNSGVPQAEVKQRLEVPVVPRGIEVADHDERTGSRASSDRIAPICVTQKVSWPAP